MGMEEVIVGVVGVLQFDVLKYRLENEYNVEIRMDTLPYEHIRWIENEDIDMDKLVGTSDMKKIQDLMIMGYSGNLEFERDFVAEGVDMLNRYQEFGSNL